jgi:trehalose 6-phosphate phosphatase
VDLPNGPNEAHSPSPAAALLAERLCRSAHASALFLDVDGTLLDIAATPDAVVVPAALRDALAQLAVRLDGALALVSGRPVAELDQLFAPLRLAAAGGHGAQWRLAGNTSTESISGDGLPEALRRALVGLARQHPGVLVEDKGHSIALHYRGAPAAREALEEGLTALLATPVACGLRVLPGKMVFEVLAGGFDKAQAVRRFVAVPPFAGRAPVFIGDDVTDGPAIALMPQLGGLALAVGRPLPGAQAIFDDAAAVRAALVAAARAR